MFARKVALAVVAVALGAAASQAQAASTVTGKLTSGGVVWIDDGSTPAPVTVEMHNAGKAFVPDLLIVTAGSSVRFPNDDPFFHSIYSISTPNAFDIGFYATGPGKIETFAAPGIIDVRCHIHVFMRGTIVVVSGPFASAAAGPFLLTDVAPGTHTVYAWSAAAGMRTTTIRVPRDGSIAVDRPL